MSRARHSAKPPSQRQLRVGEEIRHVLAWMLERGEIHDPGLAGTPVTVTEVRASPDLKNATVFVTPLGGGDARPVLEALRRARPFLRRTVAGRVDLKFVPDLAFEEDTSFARADRIEALLHRPDVRRDIDPHGDAADDAPGEGGPDGA